jgi:hypothetical protein
MDVVPAGNEPPEGSAGTAAGGPATEAAEQQMVVDAGGPEEDVAGHPADAGVAASGEAGVPATGVAAVDATLRSLDVLAALPVEEHPAVFERIHSGLADALGDPQAQPGADHSVAQPGSAPHHPPAG